MKLKLFLLLNCFVLFSHCWLEKAAGNQISYATSDFEYVLKSATAAPKIWTTVVTRRIVDSDSAPSTVGSDDTLRLFSAANELESFQIVVDKSGKANVKVDYPATFSSSSIGLSCGAAGFSQVSAWGQGTYQVADTVTPFASGTNVPLSSSRPTVLFCTATVPASTTGKTSYSATITLTVAGNSAVNVNVNLYVFGFALTTTSPFQTYFQSTPTTTLSSYSLAQLDAFKAVYLQHHWNSRNTAWSGGFKAWRNGNQDSTNSYWNPTTKALVDANSATSTTSCVYANGCLGLRYSTGKSQTWNSVTTGNWLNGDGGFSVWEYASLEDGRPDPFDGVSCGTNPSFSGSEWQGWMCSNAYETEFGLYLKALESFTSTNNLNSNTLTRAFFYTINEPTSYNDYTVAAYLCKTIRAQAPNLPIMLTREAHPWVISRSDSLSCGYDIWISHVSRFPADITWDRQVNHGEISWFYSLDTDNECAVGYGKTCSNCICNPSFAPFISNTGNNGDENPRALNAGMHYRVIPWVAWANRITGWGYYKDSVCWTQANKADITPVLPTIAASLIREGIDDYAYIWAANNRAHADPYTYVPVDDTVVSVGFGVYAWNNNPYALQALRNELGKYVEGTRNDIPYLNQPYVHPYADYNIDFGPYGLSGNTYGAGTTFTSGGLDWLGIGFPSYDNTLGYGWNSYMTGVPNTIQTGNPVLHCQDTQAGLGSVNDTICYDDYNHVSTFFFALAAGNYQVTVGVGWPTKSRGDVEYIRINNVVLRNYTCNGDCVSVREYSAAITVRPHSNGATLVMTVGSPFVNQYTILNYLKIRATGPTTASTATTTRTGTGTGTSTGTGTGTGTATITTTTTRSRSSNSSPASAVAQLPSLLAIFLTLLAMFMW